MGIKKMQGTSAHLEYIGPKGRKRRSSCVYNKKGTCYDTKSSTYMGKCVGRIYCKYFDDTKEAREHFKEDLKEIKSYKLSGENNKNSKNKKNNKNKRNTDTKIFTGAKNVRKIDGCQKITLLCLETKELLQIEIVPDAEANPKINKYSDRSVVARKIRFSWIGSVLNLPINEKRGKFKIVEMK